MISSLIRMRVQVAVLFAPWALAAAAAQTPRQDPPKDPVAFTAFLSQRFRAASPGLLVETKKPLTLRIQRGGNSTMVYLGRIFEECQRGGQCDIDGFVGQMSARRQSPDRLADLRLIVRPSMYVETLRAHLLSLGAKPVAKPLVGDLWEMVARDEPTTIENFDTRDMVSLGLTPDAAMAAARAQLEARTRVYLGKLFDGGRKGAIVGLSGSPYEASLLAYPELWAKAAGPRAKDLLVAVPGADVVVFTTEGAGAAKALAQVAAAAMPNAARPFSAAVYRLKGDGWEVVAPAR